MLNPPSNKDVNEVIELHLKQADFFREKVKSRQTAQYTINLAFWTLLLLIVKFLVDSETRLSHWVVWPVTVTLIFLHALWLYGLSSRNDIDGRRSGWQRDRSAELLSHITISIPGIDLVPPEPTGKEGSEFHLVRWPHLIELVVTVLLGLAVCITSETRLRTTITTIHIPKTAITNRTLTFVVTVAYKIPSGYFCPSQPLERSSQFLWLTEYSCRPGALDFTSMETRWSDGTTKSKPDNEKCPNPDPRSLLVRCFTAKPSTIGDVTLTAVFDGVGIVHSSVDSKLIEISDPKPKPHLLP